MKQHQFTRAIGGGILTCNRPKNPIPTHETKQAEKQKEYLEKRPRHHHHHHHHQSPQSSLPTTMPLTSLHFQQPPLSRLRPSQRKLEPAYSASFYSRPARTPNRPRPLIQKPARPLTIRWRLRLSLLLQVRHSRYQRSTSTSSVTSRTSSSERLDDASACVDEASVVTVTVGSLCSLSRHVVCFGSFEAFADGCKL